MEKQREELELAETSRKYGVSYDFYMEVVDDVMASVLRQKTPSQRLEIADRMWIGARSVVRASIVSKEPNLTLTEIDKRVARRMFGGDLPDAAE